MEEKPASHEAVHKCVLTGFADHLARRLDMGTLRCALLHSRKGVLARASVVTAPFDLGLVGAQCAGWFRALSMRVKRPTANRLPRSVTSVRLMSHCYAFWPSE